MDEDAQESSKKIYMQLFKGLIDQIHDASSDAMLNGAQKLLDDPDVAKYMGDNKMQPYIYLAGMLNLLGRDINQKTMSKVLKAVEIEPDGKLTDALLNANNENNVIYIYAIYFLVILGREQTLKNIMDVVNSLGIKPNENFAKDALEFYTAKYSKK